MHRIARAVASLRLTLAAMILLALTVLLAYRGNMLSGNWIVLPIAVLALNLIGAIATNPRIHRSPALLVFHACLLLLAVLAGVNLLTRFEARVEIVEGEPFSAEKVQVVTRGPWHRGGPDAVRFVQGPVEVDYAAANTRQRTRSTLYRADDPADKPVILGENQAMTSHGYRFVTTSNKGFAVMMSWHDAGGEPIAGAIHLPSYPLYEWKQENVWTTPAGQAVTVRLALPGRPPPGGAWTLRAPGNDARLEVGAGNGQRQLVSGESILLNGGRLRFDGVRVWMGYRIDYDGWLPAMFVTALLAVVSIGWHFHGRFRSTTPREVAELSSGRWVGS